MCFNIPAAPIYGVYTSYFVRYLATWNFLIEDCCWRRKYLDNVLDSLISAFTSDILRSPSWIAESLHCIYLSDDSRSIVIYYHLFCIHLRILSDFGQRHECYRWRRIFFSCLFTLIIACLYILFLYMCLFFNID